MDEEKLICLVEEHPVIFDVTDSNYKNILIKEKAWEEIAEVVNFQGTVPQYIISCIIFKPFRDAYK